MYHRFACCCGICDEKLPNSGALLRGSSSFIDIADDTPPLFIQPFRARRRGYAFL